MLFASVAAAVVMAFAIRTVTYALETRPLGKVNTMAVVDTPSRVETALTSIRETGNVTPMGWCLCNFSRASNNITGMMTDISRARGAGIITATEFALTLVHPPRGGDQVIAVRSRYRGSARYFRGGRPPHLEFPPPLKSMFRSQMPKTLWRMSLM
jgi:hypothetical protein